jgi:hypothetical protein
MDTGLKKMMSVPVATRAAQKAVTGLAAITFAVLVAGCGSMGMGMGGGMAPVGKVSLNGASEVPAVGSGATGSGVITVAADHTVSGSVSTTGIEGKAAHIHMAAKGANGPVIVPLTKSGEGTWSVPAGTRLTDAQYAAYVAGDMYVNVHSAAHPGGEIRGQLSAN